MATQNFDQLNILKRRSEPYEEYFRVMKLPPKELKRRIRLARELEDVFATFFEIMMFGVIDEMTVKQQLTYDIYDVLGDTRYFETEEQKDKYVASLVNDTYRSTVENLRKYPNDYDYTGTKNYWVSDDRAMFISEEESNTVHNSLEYIEAGEQGKTHKIWMDYGDDRVRPTHQEVNGAKVPIGVYFDVGAARMLYPRDVTSELSTGAECPEEVIGCRCRILYV